MMRTGLRIGAFCVAIFAGLLMAVPSSVVSANESTATQLPVKNILTLGTMEAVDSLNPLVGLTDISQIFYSMVYDCLQSVDEDLHPVPNLATSWWTVPTTDPELVASGEPYGSVWEYNLTKNAVWTDGEPFTVDDAVWTINLNSDPLNYDSMWKYQPYAYSMKYAEVVTADKMRIHFYDRVSEVPIPVAYGDSLFIHILPKHKLEQYSPSHIAFNWSGVFEGEDPAVVGTGPFMATPTILNDWRNYGYLDLDRNPNYHGGADRNVTVKFDGVRMVFFDNAQAMTAALKTGVIDIAAFPPQTYRAIKADVDDGILWNVACVDGLKCNQYWTDVSFCMNPGGPNNARLDPAVRHAMAMATNKTFIVNTYYSGLAQEGSTLISPLVGDWHYEPNATEKYTFDKAAAEALLDAADYTRPSPGAVRVIGVNSIAHTVYGEPVGKAVQFEMLVRQEHPEENSIAFYLDQQWNQIGIDLNVQLVDEATLATIAYSYDYDTLIWYWSSDPDPNYILFAQTQKAWNGWSDNHYSDPLFEVNYSQSVSALDPADRKAYVDNCQRIHYADCSYIILAYPNQNYAFRTDKFYGWGNPSAHPGRSMDAYWGANPLWFDLTPVSALLPSTEIEVRGTAGEDGWFVSAVTVYLNASGGVGGVNHTYYEIDYGAWQEYTAPFVVADSGGYTIRYYSVDTDGNEEIVSSTLLKIDTQAPQVVKIGQISDGNGTAHWWYTLRDNNSGINRSQYSLDNGTSWTEVDDLTSVNTTSSFQEIGSHTIMIKVWDNASNYAESSLTITKSEETTIIFGLTLIGLAAIAGVVAIVVILIAYVLMRRKKVPPAGEQHAPPSTAP